MLADLHLIVPNCYSLLLNTKINTKYCKMSEEFQVKDKVFIITGAASGLGAGFAERFLKEGAKHIAILDVAVSAGEETAKKLNAQFGAGKASFTKCDVTDEEVLTNTFKTLVQQHKTVDVVINNAGIMDDSPRLYRKANDINWQALVTLSVLAWEHMRKDKGGAGGTIVNISSVAGLAQWPFMPIYSAAKAAVLHFSTCLGMEPNYSRSGVRVLCICFGETQTPLMQNVVKKCMDEAMGQGFQELVQNKQYQRVESAVTAMVTMVKEGKSGSSWLAVKDRPVQDISGNLEAAFAEIAKTDFIENPNW